MIVLFLLNTVVPIRRVRSSHIAQRLFARTDRAGTVQGSLCVEIYERTVKTRTRMC
jgi:hypothetical protein